MGSKNTLLPGRRWRPSSRMVRRLLITVLIAVFGLIALGGYIIYKSFGDSEGVFPPELVFEPPTGKGEATATTDAAGTAGGEKDITTTMRPDALRNPDAIPYSENLDELVQLLRIYTEARGVHVNRSALHALEGLPNGAAAASPNRNGEEEPRKLDYPAALQLAGVHLLRNTEANASAATAAAPSHLDTDWVLDDPDTIQNEQLAYVERYIAPAQADVELTPLRLLSAYYDPQSPHGLHRMAAAVEKHMNDDGYATFIQRSSTFYDPSHAARRGYGSEGSIFVAVPFAMSDITSDMVEAILARATDAATTQPAAKASSVGLQSSEMSRNPLDGADDAASAVDPDGFREIRRTAARCAATVDALFRHAHHGVAVTVGTIDVVVVSGADKSEDLDFENPSNVQFPITAAERQTLRPTRRRRYDRITCEPPSFRSGWDDASYGFSAKDNLRQRKVVVPLTQLRDASARKDGTAAVRLPSIGRYATLQLYRGESYVFLLRPGALVLPNWDLKLRLLYLRTPQRERAVLSSRPTPSVAWQAVAAALLKTWQAQPYLSFSAQQGGASPMPTTAGTSSVNNSHHDGTTAVGHEGNHVRAPPPLDWSGKQLLQGFPQSIGEWLKQARGESALSLWLVCPRWLWQALPRVAADWRALSSEANADGSSNDKNRKQQQPDATVLSMPDVFRQDTLREVFGKASGDAPPPADFFAEAGFTFTPDGTPGAQLRGRGPRTSTPQLILPDSLTEAEVYKLIFLNDKRPPMPNEPIINMEEFVKQNASAAAGTANAGDVLCGTAGTPLSYFSPATSALVKRAFEYCWLWEHRTALRALARRLVQDTSALTILSSTPASETTATGAGEVAKARCAITGAMKANDERIRWYTTSMARSAKTSDCLRDMRYLDPTEPSLTNEAAAATEASTLTPAAQQSWFQAPSNAGVLRGDAKVRPPRGNDYPRKAQAAAATAEESADTAVAGASSSSATPFVLQSVASADLLFGPAEAFFGILPQDRLQTRPCSLRAQLRDRRREMAHPTKQPGRTAEEEIQATLTEEEGEGGGTGTVAYYDEVPEPVAWDPSLVYLDRSATDLALTSALWTRGWNIFGLTEAVAAGDELSSTSLQLVRETPTAKVKEEETAETKVEEMCGVDEPLPAPVVQAQAFAQEKLWAMLAFHRAAGTPFGPVLANVTAVNAERTPLRRTLTAFETFAGVKLDTLQRQGM